ncbi:MAG: glycosyltransferase [Lewinellaceae bacterium]|nr:glycosyltransferase [Saprospiraceae bacterium]MCB9342105.1 glycosyltransferase [Lewinellaceae bacterium]
MRILQLCNKFPYPLKDGAAIASTYLARAYAELGHDIDLLSMNTSKHWFDTDTLPRDFNHYTDIHTVFIDNRIRPLPALLNLFSKKSYHIQRFEDIAFYEKLKQVLHQKHYDVVQLESLYLAPYISTIREFAPNSLVVLRAHNVEHEIWERVAQNSRPLKKWYLNKITPRLKDYEKIRLNDCDLVVAISNRDAEAFELMDLKRPATVAPIGIDCNDYQPADHSFEKPLSLSFIGSLDWMPNQEGLKWFLDEVWQPLLAPKFPTLQFHIGGRSAPKWLKELNMERVVFHGEVPCSRDFLNEHSVMIVPLLSGGGMRAKILEGMALGKVVLSTDIGMEGIHGQDRKHFLLANEPAQWLEAIEYCDQHTSRLPKIGQAAREFCIQHFDNLEIGRKLIGEFERHGKKGGPGKTEKPAVAIV